MDSRRVKDSHAIVPLSDCHVLRLDRGDKIMENLIKYVQDNSIQSGFFTGIGATSTAEIGWFNPQTEKYETQTIQEPCEITTLVGNIAWHESTPVAHTHITLGKRDFSIVGGHLVEAVIGVTCEIWICETSMKIRRAPSIIGGLKLIDFEAK
jgi:predicted DNA-binding protein with PD1-like motif